MLCISLPTVKSRTQTIWVKISPFSKFCQQILRSTHRGQLALLKSILLFETTFQLTSTDIHGAGSCRSRYPGITLPPWPPILLGPSRSRRINPRSKTEVFQSKNPMTFPPVSGLNWPHKKRWSGVPGGGCGARSKDSQHRLEVCPMENCPPTLPARTLPCLPCLPPRSPRLWGKATGKEPRPSWDPKIGAAYQDWQGRQFEKMQPI